MALRIISASEPIVVQTIVAVIYGTPGVGKTSLGFSAHAPLLLDTDSGAHRSGFRRDCVRPESWSDIAGITKEDVAGYKTLVLDTSGRALDMLAIDIIRTNPKLGRGGALTLQGYGELKSRFIAYLNLMRSFGLDIVLIAHSDEKQQGDETIERIDMQGASKNEVYKSADAMARLGVAGGKRILSFSPTDTRFGKDPAGIGTVEVPALAAEPLFLGNLIERIKAALNAQSAEQQKEAEKAGEWAEQCKAAGTPEALTALVGKAKRKAEKQAILAAANAKGWTWDADAEAFTDPNAPEPEEAESDAEPALPF